MIGVPLQMTNHKRLLNVIRYLCGHANDPAAMCEFDVGPVDRDGNHTVTIKVQSRVPFPAARAILIGDTETLDALAGFGSIKAAKLNDAAKGSQS